MQIIKFIIGGVVFATAYTVSHRVINKKWPDVATTIQITFAFVLGGALNPLVGA